MLEHKGSDSNTLLTAIHRRLGITLTTAQLINAQRRIDDTISKSDYHANIRKQGIIWKKYLLTDDAVRLVSTKLEWMFNTKIAAALVLLSIASIVAALPVLKGVDLERLPAASNAWSIALGYLIGFLILAAHELGHATALHRFDERTNGLGIGIFIFLPFAFTDVTRSWLLPKGRRMCVDLGGFYFQMVATMITLIVYMVVPSATLLIALSISFGSFIFAANPFMRNDGYWFFADLLNEPELKRISYVAFGAFCRTGDRAQLRYVGYALCDILFTTVVLLLALLPLLAALKHGISHLAPVSASLCFVGALLITWGLYRKLKRVTVPSERARGL